jgi:hypothetical protein
MRQKMGTGCGLYCGRNTVIAGARLATAAGAARLVSSSVPGRERKALVLVGVIDGGLEVYGDGVVARDFGGKADIDELAAAACPTACT